MAVMIEKDPAKKEAIQKIKNLVRSANICMVTNNILEWPLQHESLSNQWIDPEGNIWFLCFSTASTGQFYTNGNMEVFYSNAGNSQFLSLVGTAELCQRHHYPPFPDFPFAGNKINQQIDTPLGIVKFSPQEAYYWNDEVKDMIPLLLRTIRKN